MSKHAVFVALSLLLTLHANLHATLCDSFNDINCTIYDISNIKVAHANFIEHKLRKSHPQFFGASGKKIVIKYVEFSKSDKESMSFTGYVNLKELLDSYGTKTPYTIHLRAEQNDNEFNSTVIHEIGHLLNFVCVASRLENDYKYASESFKKMVLNGTFKYSYFSDVSKAHDDRHVEHLADIFKEHVLGAKPIPKELEREFCLDR